MKSRLGEYLKSYRLSFIRWLVVGSIAGSIFLADFFLRRDISDQVANAWSEACIASFSVSACNRRVNSHHTNCFKPSYSSMLLRFGKSRVEALNIEGYEACMSQEFDPTEASGDVSARFSISGELER